MDANTKISDSPTTDDSVVTKGFTQIALGAAAGAFVAMRMNRSALLLTAGLAYAYWKKSQSGSSGSSCPESVVDEDLSQEESTEESFSELAAVWQAPEAPAQTPFQWTTRTTEPEPNLLPSSSLQPFFTPPVAMVEPEAEPDVASETVPAPVESAWADFRAAIVPAITAPLEVAAPLEEKAEPSVSSSENSLVTEEETTIEPPISAAPPMGDMEVCLPSDPMVLPTMDETAVLPGDMLMIEQVEHVEEEAPQSLFFEAPAELPQTPQSLRLTETLIVPKPITQPLVSEPAPKEMSLSAPVMVPRDLRARKSFFDWLRG
ncbi:MAG: hypothetical protein NTV80_13480 [Verrucomicrobia bacterium]|nr:hypothetical protein [Verrucomicrobiota bacterium]